MDRREFLKEGAASLLALPLALTGCAHAPQTVAPRAGQFRQLHRRVRPGDAAWPSDASWDTLRRDVGGRLIRVESPLQACRTIGGVPCAEVLHGLHNPYYIGDEPALTQTSGWIDAWRSTPSVYAVAAAQTSDVVAAVAFARRHNLRLVVRGGGHSYQGTSNAPDSLLVWTRAMNRVVLHDAYSPSGCADGHAPQPAVTVEAGAIWMHVYDAVTTKAGRYVQGGGCATVGVAGLIQSGGFGSFSKRYGLAAASLLEAEVVTADGAVRIANACTNPDLFWALKGGGGGTFGVVTRVTLRTWELPEYVGGVLGTLRADSDAAFRSLTTRVLALYRDRLFDPHWGEQMRFGPGNVVSFAMVFQGLNRREAADRWQPLLDWLRQVPRDFTWETPLQIVDLPARNFWDADFLRRHAPGLIASDDRPGAPKGNILWAGDRAEAGQFLHGYRSVWLPASLLDETRLRTLADALFAASRHWGVALHFNKGLAGAPAEAVRAAADTAMNPVALDAFALAIIAGHGPPAFADMLGHGPDAASARRDAAAINRAMEALSTVVTERGSYVAESDFFERDWQRSYWGPHYPRLAAAKRRYDPDGLFVVHHGVGSEEWSADGFTRLAD